MRRTTRFQALNKAHVDFDYSGVHVGYLPPTRNLLRKSGLRILCRELDWQLPSVAQVITSFFPSIYRVEHLYVYGSRYLPSQWEDDIENMQWLEIFYPFIAVKNLYVSKKFAQCVTPAMTHARPRRGNGDRCVTCTGESFFGRAPAIGTCSGCHWAVRCCKRALRLPCSHF